MVKSKGPSLNRSETPEGSAPRWEQAVPHRRLEVQAVLVSAYFMAPNTTNGLHSRRYGQIGACKCKQRNQVSV